MEVLGVDCRIACIQVGRFQQALNDQCHICIERFFYLFQRNGLFQDRAIEQEGDDGSPFQADLCRCYQGGIYIADQAVDAILVSPVTVECDNPLHQLSHFPYILFLQKGVEATYQLSVFREEVFSFFLCKERLYIHSCVSFFTAHFRTGRKTYCKSIFFLGISMRF